MHRYQDLWIRGRVIPWGRRECAHRYEVVAQFCRQYRRPFTVLDIGAAQGYFSLRLAADFDCTVVAVERRRELGAVLLANGQHRVLWLRRSLSLRDIEQLAGVEHFDVVLALSVIHWLGAHPADSIRALRLLGDHTILELAQEQGACGQTVVRETAVPPDAQLLGYGASHVRRGAERPIVVLSTPKTRLQARYLGDCRPPPPLTIESSFDAKTVRKGDAPPREWHRGINLQTWLRLGGQWPARTQVARLVRSALHSHQAAGLPPWDIILQGDAVRLLGIGPPSLGRRAGPPASCSPRRR